MEYGKPALCFVISTGRCGSTALSDVLGLHPSIVSVSELFSTIKDKGFGARDAEISGKAFWDILSEPVIADSIALRNGLEAPRELLYGFEEVTDSHDGKGVDSRPGVARHFTRMTGIPPILMTVIPHLTNDADKYYKELEKEVLLQPDRSSREHFRWLFLRFAKDDGAEVVVERSGGSLSYAHHLLDLFPESQVIHLYRDGRDCAISMRKHPQFKFALVRRLLRKRLGWDPYDMRFTGHYNMPAAGDEIEAAGSLACFLPETFDRVQFEQYNIPLEKYGAFWSSIVLGNVPMVRQHSKVLEVCYEDLVTTPIPQLRRICEFLRLDHNPGWGQVAADTLHTERAKRWMTLAPDKQHSLTRVCSPGLQYLYGNNWLRPVEGES